MRRRRCRINAVLLVAVGAASIGGALVPRPVGAAIGFHGVAAAEGVRFGVIAPGAPLSDQVADSGGPVAQATLDSLGQSRGFASLPYPGETATGLPGTIAGFTGGQAALPQYPAHVASDHPTQPDSVQDAPGYSLHAHSDGSSSDAEARTGAGDGDTTSAGTAAASAALRSEDDGTVFAEATSMVDAVVLGPLRFDSIRSHATARLDTNGQVEATSTMDVTAASVSGTPIGIGPDGLVLAGTTTPLPANDPVLAALDDGGVTVTYLAAREQDGGVIAPLLQITMADVEVPGVGTATVIYRFGGAAVALRGAPPAAPSAEPVQPAAVSEPRTPAAPTAAGTGPPSVALPARSGTDPAMPSDPAAATELPAWASHRDLPIFDVSAFYAVLVGVGAAGTGAAQLLRLQGVRSRWTT